MLEFLNLEPETFGLDINDLSLKVVKLKKKFGVLKLASFGESEMPKGIIKDGVIKNEDELVKNIKKTLDSVKGEKLKTKYVVASLPEEKAFSQVIAMPRMKREELESAVPFEAENHIPLPSDQVYLDFKEINSVASQSEHLDVLVVAAEKSLVDSYVSALKKASLTPIALEPETQAIVRVLIKNQTSSAPVAIMDFGGDNADFIIFSGGSVRLTSSISASSREITYAISENLGINLREAEHMKIKYGFSFDKANHRSKAVSKAIAPILKNLVEEAQKHIDFYSDHDFHEHTFKKDDKNKKIGKLILSGGAANLKGLDEFLQKNLNLAVEFGDPWINFPKTLKNSIPLELKSKSLFFSTAIGLAVKGAAGEHE